MKGAVAEAPCEVALGALGLSLKGYGLSRRISRLRGANDK
ncbi:hypothetical protein LOT_1335 [Lentilactobacillus otakiensis DSM 19908 = JCM 15040]|uniref:Uncharacterized protein n=1 Tax=Lentilactobacillus otakiensis DSM 19908 = JCM 15040 TaxID=1423780 RepID=S4NHX4_9LACO|nr:hypothetical protein LOT_1335 [Lentilactobacillus otakiensis DSM 19908 = JCM 15040]